MGGGKAVSRGKLFVSRQGLPNEFGVPKSVRIGVFPALFGFGLLMNRWPRKIW
jgi:hypothetical protein